jgi:hypothetical protein
VNAEILLVQIVLLMASYTILSYGGRQVDNNCHGIDAFTATMGVTIFTL